MKIELNASELSELLKQDPKTKSDGGYQSLLVGIQQRVDPKTSSVVLTPDELDRIARYAFDYGNGGWEDRLTAIFSRSLGAKLGRK